MADKSYSVDVVAITPTNTSYTTTGYFKKIDAEIEYETSAMLIRTPQCQSPPFALLPTIVAINLHFSGDNIPSMEFLPTIVSINLQAESC